MEEGGREMAVKEKKERRKEWRPHVDAGCMNASVYDLPRKQDSFAKG